MKSASTQNERILVVDDKPNTLEVIQRNLTAEGYTVFKALGVAKAIEVLEGTSLDLVVTDLKMPKISGMDLIRHVRENFKDTEVIMITGYPSIEGAVNAVKSGAEEFLPKPFTDQELLSAVRRTLDKLKARRSEKVLSPPIFETPSGIIGQSQVMHSIFKSINKAA
ncbi:sigma-54-dependent transcriptional regulator, partial [Planctomycetota bacterium]